MVITTAATRAAPQLRAKKKETTVMGITRAAVERMIHLMGMSMSSRVRTGPPSPEVSEAWNAPLMDRQIDSRML